jgi:hypothetical protein
MHNKSDWTYKLAHHHLAFTSGVGWSCRRFVGLFASLGLADSADWRSGCLGLLSSTALTNSATTGLALAMRSQNAVEGLIELSGHFESTI